MKVVILGTAHGSNRAGKHSPDKKISEYKYSREIVAELKKRLEADGYKVFVDIAADEVPTSQSAELRKRCDIVNGFCKTYGKDNCIYVSIHINAAGGDGKWHDAGGWCAYTSRGKTKADELATKLYEAAQFSLCPYAHIMEEGKKSGDYSSKQRAFRTDYSDGDPDQESDFYVLAHTSCPAVLTENLFQDNKKDVAFLESDLGKNAIIETHRLGIINYFNAKNMER